MFENNPLIDFSASYATTTAIAVAVAMPFFLFLLVQIPGLKARNALQFLLAFAFSMLCWIGSTLVFLDVAHISLLDTFVALSILGSASLLYLEVWALLSRGYTLGLIKTLYLAETPLDQQELALRYRHGDGLSWIMRHRLSGLAAAKLVTIRGTVVALTPLGSFIGRLYKMSIAILGLRKTG